MKSTHSHGRIALSDGIICFDGADMSSDRWSVPLSRLAIVAEFTDPGQWGSYDWVLILIEKSGTGHAAPMYAEGVDELLTALQTVMGSEIRPALASSVDFASHILWPLKLAGQPLYRILPSPHGGWFFGWLRRVWERFWGTLYYELTPEAKSLLSDVGS
jgi:hypothetical protein